METVIAFIVIFGSLVSFHELGHFLFAKRAGIMVREFAIGFGPKIIGIRKGETLIYDPPSSARWLCQNGRRRFRYG